MKILKHFNSLFWSDNVWLPPNITWEDLRNTDRVNYAQFNDLQNGFTIALALLVLRYYVLERYIFSPIGCYLGLKPKIVKKISIDTESKILEKAFCENRKIGYEEVQGLAKRLDWSERKVERWIRRRLSRGKPSTLNKFTESAWRLTFYLCFSCYGLYALWDKPWFWDSKECFVGYPHHSITNDVWWYYMIQLGFYWSLTISQFTDAKRKDFSQVFVHHILTILLLTLSWTCHYFRIGSLVFITHDFAEFPLEAAKMAKYVGKQRVADVCFAVFTVAWILSRLVLFPCRVVYYAVFESRSIAPTYPYYIFNSLFCALQILHIVWTWMIIKIALRAVSSKNPGVKDLRSDSGENESDNSNSEHEADTKNASNQSTS